MRVWPWRLWAALKASFEAASWAGRVGSSLAGGDLFGGGVDEAELAGGEVDLAVVAGGAHGWAEGSAEDGAGFVEVAGAGGEVEDGAGFVVWRFRIRLRRGGESS